MWRELNYRETDAGRIQIWLEWNSETSEVRVRVEDSSFSETTITIVEPKNAGWAFQHPFSTPGEQKVSASNV